MLTARFCLNTLSYPPARTPAASCVSHHHSIVDIIVSFCLLHGSDRAEPWASRGLSGKQMPLPNWEPPQRLPKGQFTRIKAGGVESTRMLWYPEPVKPEVRVTWKRASFTGETGAA